MDFSKLKNKYISVLITGKANKKETYMGIVTEVNEYLIMKSLPSDKFVIEQFIIRLDLIESVWVFKDSQINKKV